MWKSNAGPVDDGLSKLVIVALEGLGSSFERIPDFLAALKGRRRIPEFIALAPQLAVCHWVVTLPFGLLSLQGLITPQCHYRTDRREQC